jgi:Ca2+-binding EF-hand superfamily protein
MQRKKSYRFSDEEFLQFVSRFEQYALRGFLSRQAFKESLGIFGIDSLGFLSDRMFQVMDQEGHGRIQLKPYLDYFDDMLHGTEEEK